MSTMMHDPVFYVILMVALVIGMLVPLVVMRVLAFRERSDRDVHHDPHLG